MNIRPIGERILIKSIKIEKKSASGIILSSKEDSEQNIGEVIALGEGEKLTKSSIKIGDKVICDKYAGNVVRDGKEKLLIINAEDVLGIIE